MTQRIDHNFSSPECNMLRDKINEMIDEQEKEPKTKSDFRLLSNGRPMLNGKLISTAKAKELGYI